MDIKKLLKNLKLHEPTISMLLGAVVIIITGVLIINYFDAEKGEIITTIETEGKINLPTTHIIGEGEDLWKIAEKYYESGYNWIDIANENNISNPDQIYVGQELIIPDVQQRLAYNVITPTISPEVIISPTLTQQKNTQTDLEKMHVVSKGESLWNIAEKYYQSGYNWVDIAKENNIENKVELEVGQKLTIPNVEKRLATVLQEEDIKSISGDIYIVVKGDSLWDIAVRKYGDGYKWINIARENNLVNPNIIHTGNVLTLPI